MSKLTTYDPAEDLLFNEAAVAFMIEAFETNDAAYIVHAMGVVARAKGMAQIAAQAGISCEELYRSFGQNHLPTFKVKQAVMKALEDRAKS